MAARRGTDAVDVKTLFLAWQDPQTRRWFPVGRLEMTDGVFRFDYTRGAAEAQALAGFTPLPSFPEIGHTYRADTLFPLFANRVLSPSRPDYSEFVEYLSLPRDAADPFALLARSGGRRQTDTLEVFPAPDVDANGCYETRFFVRGLRYMHTSAESRAGTLQTDEILSLTHDLQNPQDTNAHLLRTEDFVNLGYLPRYLAEDVFGLLQQAHDNALVRVERVNLSPAPVQFRVLCRLTFAQVGDFQPFRGATYQPMGEK